MARKTRRRWSAMELAYLQEAWETDQPIGVISRHLGRTMAACREKVHRMGVKRAVGIWLK